MIDHLTPEQEALLPVYKEKWTKIGLCCDRVTHEMAERVRESDPDPDPGVILSR